MNPRTALICGITGQNGSYMAARRDLGWMPTVGFAELVRIMVNADMTLVGIELERTRPDGQFTASGRQS